MSIPDKNDNEFSDDDFDDEDSGETLDPVLHIQKTSKQIYEKKKNEFEILRLCYTTFTYLTDRKIPTLYSTRDGHEIENVPGANLSSYDASRHVLSWAIQEFSELYYNLLTGTFHSAVRSSRVLYRWIIRIVSALTDLSIITGKKEDRYTPGCFFAFIEIYKNSLMRKNITKFESKSFLKQIDLDKKTGRIDVHDEMLLKTDIDFDIDFFINQFNSLIYESIELKKPETDEILTGKTALKFLNSLLDDYPYNDLNYFEKNQSEDYHQQLEKDFDKSFSIIIIVLDIIITLILILIDFDVYHGNKEWRLEWRNDIKKITDLGFNAEQFRSLNALFNSRIWNSNPPEDCVI